MAQVRVARAGVSADEVARVIRAQLGDDVEITPGGSAELDVRRSFWSRAKVAIRSEVVSALEAGFNG